MILGFCFAGTDHWGSAAAAVMREPDAKHTGSTVWRECFGDDEKTGKALTILKTIRREVHKLCACLEQGRELNPADFCLLTGLAEEAARQTMPAEELTTMARTLQQNAERLLYQAKGKLGSMLTIHTRRTGYRDLYDLLSTEIVGSGEELDPDDLEVVLDAHDLTCTVETLILVTGDLKHLVSVQEIICKLTGIHEVRFLAVYTR